MAEAITIHGPQVCPRPCVDCDPGHHWLPDGYDPDDLQGQEEEPHIAPILAYDREHGTEHILGHYTCKHCPAWISDEDYTVLEDELFEAEEVDRAED